MSFTLCWIVAQSAGGLDLAPESAMLASFVKPIFIMALFTGWGLVATKLDKDAAYFFLPNRKWNMAHIGAAVLGLLFLFVMPFFLLGLLMALLVMVGEVFIYAFQRNKQVAEKDRWTFDPKSYLRDYEQRKVEKAKAASAVKLRSKDGENLDIPIGDDPQSEAFEFFTETLMFAVPRSAQKIEFTVSKEAAGLKVMLDGVEYPQKAPEPRLALEVINFLKKNAGMDVEEVRRKQSGVLYVEVEEYGSHAFELTSIGTTRSVSLTMEMDIDKHGEIPFDQMGFMDTQVEAVRGLAESRGHVVLIATPPLNGSSTLLYNVVKLHDPYTTTVMAYERQTQVHLEGVDHREYPEGASNEQICRQLSLLLRSEPHAMMLTNGLLDLTMAREVIATSDEVRFYIPLPAKDAFSAVQTWLAVCRDPEASAKALGGVISARLVRRLCHTCRVAYTPDANALRKMNLPPDKVGTLYKSSGKVIVNNNEVPCPDCLGVGYRGRTGAFEVFTLDDQARQLLAAGKGEEFRAYLRKQQMHNLQESCLHHVASGVTDIREVARVLNPAN